LWVENSLPGTITEFKGATLTTPGASVPNPALTNHSANLFPDTAGVTFDSSKNQWAAVCGNNSGNHGSITEYTAAAVANLATNSTPAANVVLSDDGTGTLLNCPWQTVFDKSGNLWAANSNEFRITAAPGFVTEYQPGQLVTGHPTPHITLTDSTEFFSPTGVVFDSTGNLFVSDFGPLQFGPTGSGAVFVFKAATVGSFIPGTNNVKADAKLFGNTTATPLASAFDSSGNLWVADCESFPSGELYMFPKAVLTSGASQATTVFQPTSISTPNGTESTINCPGGIAFDAQGNLWYTNFYSKQRGSVGEFTRSQLLVTGKSSPTPNIFLDGNVTGTNFNQPIGLTFSPGQ
jgi:secreted PhoX family phosphatase